MKKLFFVLSLFALMTVNIYSQAIPKQINYQGVLKDASGNLLTGDFAMTFKLYDGPTGGSLLWSETQAVAVKDGLFNVQLGSVNPINTVPFEINTFLGITIGTGTELTPRTALTPVPYSYTSMNVLDDAISTNKLKNGAVTKEKIATGQVVKSINTLRDSVTLIAGSNVTIVPSGNNLTINATGDGTGIGGSGTASYIPKFTAATTLGNSVIYQYGYNIGIGTLTPSYKLDVTSNATCVIRAVNTVSTSSYQYPAIIGISNETEGYGYGGDFQGGFSGLRGYVSSSTTSLTTAGLYGYNQGSNPGSKYGVYGYTYAQTGNTGNLFGVRGYAGGLATTGDRYAIYGYAMNGTNNYAGYFQGNVTVLGTLSKGGGSFKIDHPLDPANKYLYHSFVESPDMMNIYNGNVFTDGAGYATVNLPEWFEALNKDFRYQLTVIGDFAQAIISEKIQNNQFAIRTDKPNIEVSWQVTGIRKDAFAEKNRIPVEEMKRADEVGKYLHPEAFNLPINMSIDYEKIKEDLEREVDR